MSLRDKGVLSPLPAARESRAQLYPLLSVSQHSDLGANRDESPGTQLPGYLSQHQLAAGIPQSHRSALCPRLCACLQLASRRVKLGGTQSENNLQIISP